MLWTPSNEFRWQLQTTTGRPAVNYGTSVTPGNNTYGSYAQLISGASVTHDVYGILININSNSSVAASRNTLVTIGVDRAGGTSYTDIIPHLLGSAASPLFGACGPGIQYYFPLFIKAGSSIGAKASVNNGTVGTLRAYATLYGMPSRPDLIKVGSYVQAIGVTTGSSQGTTITSGTTSEGSWTSLGSPTKPCWWWQLGFGADDSSLNECYALDLSAGDASNKRIITEDFFVNVSTAEQISFGPLWGGLCNVATSDTIYGRMQCKGSVDSSLSMAAYGLGG